MSRSSPQMLIASFALACVFSSAAFRRRHSQLPWMHATQGDWATEWGVLDPHIFFPSRILGSVNGATGIGTECVATSPRRESLSLAPTKANPPATRWAGKSQQFRYTHNIALGVALDLHRLLGLSDTYFLASASERTGNSLSYDIPNFFQVQQIFGHQTIRLVDLAVEHLFFDKKLDVVAGRINALDDFATSPLYCFAQNLGFCGNPLSIPVNASVPSYPGAAWGIRARYEVSPEFYSMTGAYNTYRDFRSDKFHGVDFSLRHNSGVAIMEEFGLFAEAGCENSDIPGLQARRALRFRATAAIQNRPDARRNLADLFDRPAAASSAGPRARPTLIRVCGDFSRLPMRRQR